MPQFAVVVDHGLPLDEAMTRLQQFLERVRQEHADKLSDMQGAWSGNRLDFQFRAVGLPIQGQMQVETTQVNVQGNLPLAAALFRGRIEQTIRDELRRVLG